jgi:hypothetical protein
MALPVQASSRGEPGELRLTPRVTFRAGMRALTSLAYAIRSYPGTYIYNT